MTPQSSRHAAAVQLAQKALERVYGDGFAVRVQMPLAIDPDSEPEPDLAVVRGGPRDYRDAHPRDAVLVIEVADTSLAHDRGRKKEVYARCGIPAYWIVNLVDEGVEVYDDLSAGRYRSAAQYRRGEILAASIRVEDLLP